MHGLTTENGITPENNGTIPKTLPTPTPRNITQKDDEVTDSLPLEEASDDKEVDPIYATIGPKTQSLSKETVFEEAGDREETEKNISEQLSQLSNGSSTPPPTFPPSPEVATSTISSVLTGVAPPKPPRTGTPSTAGSTTSRSGSVVSNSSLEESTSGEGGGSTPTTSLPSYASEDGSEKSLLSDGKKTNRTWPRVKYAVQQKGFIISSASALILGISTALVYLQDKEKFIAFFTNSPKYVTIPVIALALLLAIVPIFCAIKQFRNTEEHQIQGKDADAILGEVLGYQPKDKVMKSVRLEYSNGTHSNFILNAWESENDFINIDEKVISRTNKIESVINDRPLFTALLTGVIAANVVFPLGLLAVDGIDGVQKFYRNPLANNMGLSFLIGSGILALLTICLGVHYYNKINCTNLIYSQEKIDNESVNKKFIEEIKQERTHALEENHSKDAKRSSLTLEQVVVQSHNYPDVVCGVK